MTTSIAPSVHAQTESFDATSVGDIPAGWTAGVTGRGTPHWAIASDPKAPSPPNVLLQSGSGSFPWCVRKNVSLYHATRGRRNTIKYVNAPVAANSWHMLRVEFAGTKIKVLLDGKAYIDLEDGQIRGAGAVGVWTKADSVTSFDDFSYGK